MYNTKKFTRPRTHINVKVESDIQEGEAMERKVEKMLAGTEAVELTRSPIYQERRDGVNPAYNIRADTHEILREAVEASTQKYFEARKIRQETRHAKDKVSDGAESTRTSENQ